MSKTGRPQAAWSCSALALAVLLNGTGCLRFGYSQVDNKSGATFDAGVDAGTRQNRPDASSQPDAQLTAAGGSGASGAGGTRANAGSGGSRSGVGSADAGERDAAVLDASAPSDAGMAAAGSSGGGAGGAGAGGTGGGGGAGVGTGTSFDDCVVSVGGVLFCNGFEGPMPWFGTMSPPLFSYEKVPKGSYDPYTASPYHGAVSGHFATTGSDSSTGARLAFKPATTKSGDLWLKYHYYVPSSFVINPYFSAGVMSSITDPFQGFALLIKPNSMTLETALSSVSTITPSATSTGFPVDRWVCVELHVFVDSTKGYIEAFLDGTGILKSNLGNSIPSGGFGTAEVGIHYVANGQAPVSVYVDNVVVSTQRFGCN